jgi:hypothetical protein
MLPTDVASRAEFLAYFGHTGARIKFQLQRHNRICRSPMYDSAYGSQSGTYE